jgi:hypothetical protein
LSYFINTVPNPEQVPWDADRYAAEAKDTIEKHEEAISPANV